MFLKHFENSWKGKDNILTDSLISFSILKQFCYKTTPHNLHVSYIHFPEVYVKYI